jgi:hypothetical protein
MIERCFDICLSQGRPDLKVQCVAKVVDPERKTATGRLRATGGTSGDGWLGRYLAEGNTRKPRALGIASVR